MANEVLFKKDVYNTKNYTIRFEALVEHIPIDETLLDESILQETIDNVNSGETVYFCAKVSLWFKDMELATEYLGCCFYDDYEEFVTKYKHDYFSDMVHTVIQEGRKEIEELKKTLCTGGTQNTPKVETYHIKTGLGKLTEPLPFLNDDQNAELDSIGYSGKTLDGTRITRSKYLNSLGLGTFEVTQTKYDNGDYTEAFTISRGYTSKDRTYTKDQVKQIVNQILIDYSDYTIGDEVIQTRLKELL